MAERGSRSTQQRARTEAERARLYSARTGWHNMQLARRRRDNWIVGVVGGVIIIGAIASQTILGQTTVPAPAPTPASSEAPPVSPEPTPTLTGGTVMTPTAEPTQTPDE